MRLYYYLAFTNLFLDRSLKIKLKTKKRIIIEVKVNIKVVNKSTYTSRVALLISSIGNI